MSKSTKIVAGLGVAAALGVAALPVASFAADYSVTVPVTAEIGSSVKIEVKDNQASTPTWVAATTADSGSTHAFADLTTVAFSGAPGYGEEQTDLTRIRVTTNYPSGYTIFATTTDLDHATAASTSIPAFTSATAIVTSGNTASGWGIRVKENPDAVSPATPTYKIGSATQYNGNDGTAAFETVSGLTERTEHEYSVDYGINVSNTQASGSYAGSVTFKVASDATTLEN